MWGRLEWWLWVVVPGRARQSGWALRRWWYRLVVCPLRRSHRIKFDAGGCVDCGIPRRRILSRMWP